MGKMDDILDKVKEMAAAAGSKAQEVAEVAKLKLQLSQMRSDLDSNYKKMCEIIYNLKKAGAENEDLVSMCVAEIDAQLEAIDELNNQINELKNEVRCPECHASNTKGNLYCARCGAALLQEEAPKADGEEGVTTPVFFDVPPSEDE